MYHIATLPERDRRVLFMNTAEKKSMHPAIVEKDFWVCLTLDYLFHHSQWRDAFVFKGGTSLSKAYHLIERFSEDIDLILDWHTINYNEEPWGKRSKTQQDKINKQMNQNAAIFLKEKLLPNMRKDLRNILDTEENIYINRMDAQTIDFAYPHIFHNAYLRPQIKLEIGPLAERIPQQKAKIAPYAAEEYGTFFAKKNTYINTIAAERTFWEKITILHKIANRNNNNKVIPERYSRHYYDLYCMFCSPLKARAYAKKELLEQSIRFKTKFYISNSSGYDTAKIGSLLLLPNKEDKKILQEDYAHMQNMIYGRAPQYEEIMSTIGVLEKEVNKL